MKRGPIARAVIRRIAEERRIPLGAAAHRYDCMSIDRKNLLCLEEERKIMIQRQTACPTEPKTEGIDKFGYPSDEPCRVCGGHDRNQSEPRFGYTVCWGHQHVLPINIPPRAPSSCRCGRNGFGCCEDT